MNHPDPRNACATHEYEADIYEPGLERCLWCQAQREAPVTIEAVPAVLVESQGRAA